MQALEATAFEPDSNETIALVWRTGVCAHLVIDGTCPSSAGQVVVSHSLASINGWHIGQRVIFPVWGTLTMTGVYTAPMAGDDYWFDRAIVYFPYENPTRHAGRGAPPPVYDAMFTPRATVDDAGPSAQGTAVASAVLDNRSVRPGDIDALAGAMSRLVGDQQFSQLNAVASSDIPATLVTVRTAWSSLAVPVLLVTLQLLGLAWLLLFLLVTEAVAARGPEVALAKLRGHGRWRTITFGLSEPAALLAVALPVGALGGWAATALLSHALLRTGTPVDFPGLGWGAATAATAGGLAAVVLASRRALRRPVVDQWRRAGKSQDRSWAIDAILFTGAAAGLTELSLSGRVGSAHRSALSLLAPGLLGVAVAVMASRLLPIVCSAALNRGRRFGLAVFLALRHVARRPGGSRTTIMLATSFALSTFALSAWAVGRENYRRVADAQVGAPTVLTVSSPPGQDLGDLVTAADPDGRMATAVEAYSSNGLVTLAVDPQGWSRIAAGSAAGTGLSRGSLAAALNPPAPPPLVLTGDAVRLQLAVQRLTPAHTGLTIDVGTPSSSSPTPVQFGALPSTGSVTETADMAGCPCTVEDVTLVPDPSLGGTERLQGTVTLQGVEVRDASGWRHVDAGLSDEARWHASASGNQEATVAAGPSGLRWTFSLPGVNDATVLYVDRPMPLPAIAASSVTGHKTGPFTATGLDGQDLPVDVLAVVTALPGAPANGVVVDRRYAELAAAGTVVEVEQQVWLARGTAAEVVPRLEAEGVTILATRTQAGTAAAFNRQGPGLATALFFAEAAAAAILAAGGAILGLYVSARRRRYELAALAASGLTRRTLLGAVAAEQLIVLAFGLLVGIATGWAAAVVALRDVPEFLTTPVAPSLSSVPPVGQVVTVLAAAVAMVLAATVVSSATIVRGVRLDQLREPPA